MAQLDSHELTQTQLHINTAVFFLELTRYMVHLETANTRCPMNQVKGFTYHFTVKSPISVEIFNEYS